MAQFYPSDVNLLARVQRLLWEEIERAESTMAGSAAARENREWRRRRDRLLREHRELGVLRERVKAAQGNG